MTRFDVDPKYFERYHFMMMIFWVMVTPITLRYPESVLWVAIMSQYANFAGEFAGWNAVRAERKQDE